MRSSAQTINITCLLVAIAIVLILPLKKEIWYDETVSVLCAKGISHDAPSLFANTNVASSATLAQLNTPANVFNATVNDNANSFLYNICLHWYAEVAGNSLGSYMLFSKLLAIATLIAFYFLCCQFFGRGSPFTAIAIMLLAVDIDFIGMSHEIRAYQMGILFVTLAAIYFYKFMYREERPVYLLLTGLFSVAAFFSHFLSVYIILVFLVALVMHKKTSLFTVKNIIALAIPVGLIAIFFAFAWPGLQTMSKQNHEIQLKTMAAGFSLTEVFMRMLKFTAINFKAVFPSFNGNKIMILLSFILVVRFYIMGIRNANDEQKRNLHLLFWLGAGSSLFLAALCVKSHHYTALYYRYFSFCLPFCSLFIAYLLYVFFSSTGISKWDKYGLAIIFVVPSFALFAASVKEAKPILKYDHIAVARQIAADGSAKIEVPEWRDAFLINSFLPAGYKIDYFCNPAATVFTIYPAAGTPITIPVIRNDE